jgi:hypothetical protein
MATLIPALGASASRMTSDERRLAKRLEQKLDDDSPARVRRAPGPTQLHPHFNVLHASRGLLILEVKDFHLQAIVRASKGEWPVTISDRDTYGKHITQPGSTHVRATPNRD